MIASRHRRGQADRARDCMASAAPTVSSAHIGARLATGGAVADAGAPLVPERAAPPGGMVGGNEHVSGRAPVTRLVPFARDLGEQLGEGVGDADAAAGAERAAWISDAHANVRSPLIGAVTFRRRGVEAKLVVLDRRSLASEPDANLVRAVARAGSGSAGSWVARQMG